MHCANFGLNKLTVSGDVKKLNNSQTRDDWQKGIKNKLTWDSSSGERKIKIIYNELIRFT